MSSGRKRKVAIDGDREGRSAKRRAKELSARVTDSDNDDGDGEPEFDPRQPLTGREIRNLYKSYTRYGLLDESWKEIVSEAGLEGRDPEMIRATIDDWIRISEEAIERQRSTHEEGKKEKKAILFDYKGVKKLNAETIVIRPRELRILKKAVDACGSERTNFRISDVKLVHNWSCQWGTREDSMLCVGIVKHGYGGWTAIRDDPELGMHNKFFLEEHRVDKKEERGKADATAKSPGAVHLVRRADYLLGILRERVERASGRSSRKSPPDVHRLLKRNGTASASPAPRPKKPKMKSKSTLPDSSRPRDREHYLKKRRHDDEDGRDLGRKKHRAPAMDTDLEVRRKRRPSPKPSQNGPSNSKASESRTEGTPDQKEGERRRRALTESETHAVVRIIPSRTFGRALKLTCNLQWKLRESEVKSTLDALAVAWKEKDKTRKSSMLMDCVRNVGRYIDRHCGEGSTEYQDLW